MANVLHSSATSDWGTPPEIVEWARGIMGSIDLDPASSAERNQVVKAARFIDAAQDGLTADWGDARNTILNPPGERTGRLARAFYRKACEHVAAGRDGERHVIWVGFSLAHLRFMEWPVLIFRKRVAFLDPTGKPATSPTSDNFLALIGGRGRGDGLGELFMDTTQIGLWPCYAMEGR